MNGTLFPYALGLAVVPGAIVGLGYMLGRPRSKIDRAVAALTVGSLDPLHRPGRAGVDGGSAPAPRALSLLLSPRSSSSRSSPMWNAARRDGSCTSRSGSSVRSHSRESPLTGLTGTTAYFFDGITLTGFARVAYLIGLTNAALLYALIPLALALLAWALPLRKSRRAGASSRSSRSDSRSLPASASTRPTASPTAGRREPSARTAGLARPLRPRPRSPALLPRATTSRHASLESWNRNLQGVVVLGKPRNGPAIRSRPRHVAPTARSRSTGRPTRRRGARRQHHRLSDRS